VERTKKSESEGVTWSTTQLGVEEWKGSRKKKYIKASITRKSEDRGADVNWRNTSSMCKCWWGSGGENKDLPSGDALHQGGQKKKGKQRGFYQIRRKRATGLSQGGEKCGKGGARKAREKKKELLKEGRGGSTRDEESSWDVVGFESGESSHE